MSKVKNIAKYSAMITIILVVSKFIGTLRELIIASQYGATIETDIFKTVTRIPNLFYGVIGAALTVSFIPAFSEVKENKEKANEFFNNILNIIIILCAILAVIGMVFSKQLSYRMASGFSEESLRITATYTKIAMPTVIFLAISGLYTGYLQSYGIFLQPALTGIVSSLVIIIGVLAFSKYGIVVAIIAFALSSVAQVSIQRPFMKGYKYKPYINLKDENVVRMLKLSVPILISTAAGQISIIISNDYASRFAEGSIAIVSNTTMISSLINQVFIISLTTVFYPMLTEKFTKGDRKGFQALFTKAINIILIVVLPLVLGLFVLSTPVIQLLLEHGKFDREATLRASKFLRYFVFSAFGYSLVDIFGKTFFSMKDTLTPMINGFIQIGLNIALIILLAPKMGIVGLALATTITLTVVSIINLLELKLRLKDISFRKIGISLLKATISSLVMAFVVSATYGLLDKTLLANNFPILALKIITSTIIGVIVYVVMLKLLKVEELDFIMSFKIFKKIKR